MKPLRCCLAVLALAVVNSALAEKQRLKLSGQLFLDADYYESFWSKNGDNSTTEAQLRRLRLQAKYDFPKSWLGKLQLDGEWDSDDSDLDLETTWLRYTGWDFADITLGKMKQPVGFERNTASARLMTIERAMMTRAFTPDKTWGVHLFNANKRRRWALAAVIEDDLGTDADDPIALSGRYTWSPVNTAQQTLQVGVTTLLRDWNENTFRIQERAEVGSADRVVRSAEFRAGQQTLLGLEGVWRQGSLQLQGEYMATRVEEVDGPDWDYYGYYITASYLFGGEQRAFRKGEFRSLRPRAGSGAWELVARYSYLDVRQRGLGSRAAVSTLGVNYYYARQIKLMLAWLYPDISGSVRHENPDGSALSLRVQFLF